MPETNIFLKHYSRKEIQDEICYNASGREVASKYGEQFGKRPDTIEYPNDVFELAKNGATSFHVSEEIWKNPLRLSTDMRKHELDSLRAGWDLIIDIDCPYWDYSKAIAHSIINSIKEHGINSISCKFSGNKGFHIGVPFESLPEMTGGKETKTLFPEAARNVMAYLIYHIDLDERLTNKILGKDIASLKLKTGKSYDELVVRICSSCKSESRQSEKKFEYICAYCSKSEVSDKNEIFKTCQRCNRQMEKKEIFSSSKCRKCGSSNFAEKLNLQSIINVDSILISSRHLYRMPYSMHEKSGLVSVPINPSEVLRFEKKEAEAANVKISKHGFLKKENAAKNEAILLFEEAFGWKSSLDKDEELRASLERPVFEKSREFEALQKAVPEELFPPCAKLILNGIEDGKKRALFMMVNFLSSVGWDYDMIEKRLIEWNEKNNPPIRQNYLLGQIRYARQIKKKILPPNCDNEMYMKDLGVCKPDNFCARIKNPANYSIRKARAVLNNKEKKGSKKKEEVKIEQQREQGKEKEF